MVIVFVVSFLSPAVARAIDSQVLIGFSGEYRFINIYGQSSGVPSYRGMTYLPEIQYALTSRTRSLRLYGNFGFGTLLNTANSFSLKEEFKYRVFGAGVRFHSGAGWLRAGLAYHTSRDEVSGSVNRVVEFKGPGLDFGGGFSFKLSSRIEFFGGLDLQLAKFSRESSPYFQGRRDYLSYAAFLGMNFIVPSIVTEIP